MKKGFTLIELLGVIILLGVLALITYPIVDNAIKNSSTKALEESINNIERAALQYSTVNKLGYDKLYKAMDIKVLKESGFLKDEQIKNPETNQPLDGCIIYVWNESSKQYIFVYSDNCALPTEEACFTFDKTTKAITDYSTTCSKDVIIPGVIGGVSVEKVENAAFSDKGITSIDFIYMTNLKSIARSAFVNNNITALDLTKLKSIEDINSYAFCDNVVAKKNFKSTDKFPYSYFSWICV